MTFRLLQSTGAWVAATGCVGVAAYAAIAYCVFPLGALVHPQMKLAFQAHSIAIYTHIFASALALGLAPLQLAAQASGLASPRRAGLLGRRRAAGRAEWFVRGPACLWR